MILIKSEIWAWLVGKYDRSSGSHPSTSDGSWYLKVCRNKSIKYQVDFCTTMYRVRGVRISISSQNSDGVRTSSELPLNFHQTGILVPGKLETSRVSGKLVVFRDQHLCCARKFGRIGIYPNRRITAVLVNNRTAHNPVLSYVGVASQYAAFPWLVTKYTNIHFIRYSVFRGKYAFASTHSFGDG